MNNYIITGTRRPVNAIGTPESFEVKIKAENEQSARDGVIFNNDYSKFEHVTIDSVNYGGYDDYITFIDFTRINSIEQLKRAVTDSGSHFFDADTMRFFNSRVSDMIVKHGNYIYFITSEKNRYNYPRAYTIRRLAHSGNIDSVGEFQEFESLSRAKTALKNYIKSLEAQNEN